MSVRYSRPLGGRPSLKKNASSKKKVQARQAWDSTVQDLNVHRATPEELARRHEMHKSKNQRLAHWELQKKSLTKKWKRENGGRVDPLQERRLALMMEILSDQYQMKDVLERSDRAMAVVKDLFGDAPPRHTGFPNVTMAPSCDLETSRGPIVQRKDPPPRLSVLSESVMDSQALNEVDDDESEYSDEEEDVSMSFQPGLNTDRIHQLLHEERSHPTSHKPPKAADPENPFVTPKSSGHPATNLAALNATEAVKKVKTRLTEEELEEPEGSKCVIGQVLNPNPPNHRRPQRKAKKKRSAPRDHRVERPLSSASASDLSCNQSSLEVLNQMIQEVEQELEDYDRQAGRQVGTVPRAQGLTGFTLSLVTSIRRLVTHVKAGDRRLRQEAEERQRLQEELHEQRLLIDALTAEILSMKEDPSFSQLSHQSASVPSPPAEGLRSSPSPGAQQKKPSPASGSSQLLSFMADLGLPDAERDLGPLAPPADRVREHAVDSSLLLGFQPAVLLSPPRQRSREELEEQQLLLKRSLDTLASTEVKDPPAPRSGHSSSEPCSIKQGGDAKSLASLSPQHPLPSPGDSSTPHTDQDCSSLYSLYNDSIADRMAEMTLQNNALKAQLRALGHKLLGDPLPPAQIRGPLQTEDKVTPQMSATPGHSPMTLEQRIAELNRQSAEARNKLLHLIEQQKQSVNISPAISPITPQCDGTEKRGRIEAVIPMPRLTDSYVEETPSPESRSSGRRSSASIRSASSMSSSVRAGGRSLVDKRKEEGWFALTAHVS